MYETPKEKKMQKTHMKMGLGIDELKWLPSEKCASI